MFSRPRLLTLLIILIAFAARLNTLGDPAFWYDEGLVGWSARLPFLETARWTAADVHPPLYFWAVTMWHWFVGESELALRFLSVSFGLLSVVAVYKIGERLYPLRSAPGRLRRGATLGNLAALFIGLSRFHIWWSQELRMYILGSMFMLFSVWLTLRIAHGTPKRGDWFAYMLVSLAGLLSIYLVAFALAFESLYITALLVLSKINLTQRRTGAQEQNPIGLATLNETMTWRKYVHWVGAQAIVALLFAPWFLYFLTQYRTWSDSTPFDFKLFVQFYATLLAIGAPSNIDAWLVPMLVVWAVLIVGALLGLRGRQREASARGGWLIVMLLVLPPLTVYLGTSPRSFFYTPRVEARYLFPFIWSFYLVLGWCVWRIMRAQRIVGALAAAAVLALMGASDQQYYASRAPSDVYQSLTAMLRAYRQPNDGVLLHDDRTWPIFEFYFGTPNKIWKGVPNGSKIKESDADFILSDFWNQHDGVWMVWNEDALRIDEQHVLEHWLAERAAVEIDNSFGNKRLMFYARTAQRALSVKSLALVKPTYVTNQFVTGDVTLLGFDQAIRSYHIGDDAALGMYWQNRGSKDVELSIGLNAGSTIQFVDRLLIAPGTSRTLTHFVARADMPAHAQLIVFTGERGPLNAFSEIAIAQPDALSDQPDVNIQTAREVRFDMGIRLVGYDADFTNVHAGDTVQLTLYWQSDQPIEQRYKAFVHVLGAQYNPKSKNFLWGQQDQEPGNGALPTTAWSVSRIVSDPYLFRITPDAAAGHYVVELGWYHPMSGERLSVLSSDGAALGDHVNLFEFDVQ